MSEGQGITRELVVGEVVAKTFELYRRDFSRYLLLFLPVDAVIGVLEALARRAIVLPTAFPANATPQQALSSALGFLAAATELYVLLSLVSWALYPFALGGAIKMASDEITTGSAGLVASVRFAASRMVWLWAVSLVFGIAVFVGFLALFIPGVLLLVMYCLALPVVVIEGTGLGSLGRSRKLVDKRWLKTFVLLVVFGIIISTLSVLVEIVTGPLGFAGTVLYSVTSSLYLPLSAISLTVYYYSNAARITPPQIAPLPTPRAPGPQPGMKFCPHCGTLMVSTAKFCHFCGTRQPA
jgi:hypothetical protein